MLRAEGACRVGSSIGRVPRLIARDLVPGETRFAHIDGRNRRPLALPTAQQSGRRFQGQSALFGFLEQQLGNAAHAVAAGASL
jgi:hypothetical protein